MNLERCRPKRQRQLDAFSLIEVIVVMGLLSFIILGLVAMFSQVQKAYKLGTTQVDVLESGRAVADMLHRELVQITPSRGSNCVNFYSELSAFGPLLQQLSGSTPNRTNLIGELFFLTLENRRWTAIGYRVSTPDRGMGTLYRYESNAPYGQNPALLYPSYYNAPLSSMSRLVDGVVHFKVRVYDANAAWITSTNYFFANTNYFIANSEVDWPPTLSINNLGVGEVERYRMTNNAVPATIEVELGVLEDSAIAKARAYTDATARRNFLTNQASHVHLFRVRAPVRNVDPTAYQ